MADDRRLTYAGEKLDITFAPKRCIHAGACVRGLPAVFDPQRKPWVDPSAAEVADVIATVLQCPTGALRVARRDGTAVEPVPARNDVRLEADGPLLCRGNIELTASDGTIIAQETRIALCRCGASKNKPYCDGAHGDAGFEDAGAVPDPRLGGEAGESRPVKITAAPDGPLILDGPVAVRDANGDECAAGTKGALCRCGASKNKPFCDGAHKAAGFEAP